MQDNLLRVFLLALGLIMYPKEDPMMENDITRGMQDHTESLLREGEKLDQEMTPEMTQIESKGSQDDAKNIHEAQNESSVSSDSVHFAENAEVPLLENVIRTHHKVSEENRPDPNSDSSLLQKPSFGSEMSLKTLLVDQEVQQVSSSVTYKERGDIQTGSVSDPSTTQSQKEMPDGKEVFSSKQEVSHLTMTSENETLKMVITDWEEEYLWYILNTFSIISMIRFFIKYLNRHCQTKNGFDTCEDRAFTVNCITSKVPVPDNDTLQHFYSKYIQPNKKWREDEFLEGFAHDLLDAMRTICDRNGSMVIEGFQMVDVCNILVPFSAPEPYSFQCLLWNNQASDLLPEMQVCGQIKLMKKVKIQNGCHCQSSAVDDDMVCLLHCDNDNVQTTITDAYDGLLCMKNTPFLSKSQVTKWFQSTIKQAWTLISHKYEFELKICHFGAPGAVIVRFRSGKKIRFNINPVVKFSTGAHFCITSSTPGKLDIFWSLSTIIYEDHLLDGVSKLLPENSCHIQTLEIAYFLHKKQTALSGNSALKDFHFKTALMHLLLTKDKSQWQPKDMACRLRDLLEVMDKSLCQKQMYHVLIGNPLTRRNFDLPAVFAQAKPVNLFHPLVVYDCIYTKAVMHFQEMLRNANMLIQDYVNKCDGV